MFFTLLLIFKISEKSSKYYHLSKILIVFKSRNAFTNGLYTKSHL